MGRGLLQLILPVFAWAACHPTCLTCILPDAYISCKTCYLHAHPQFRSASICYCDSGYYPSPDPRNCRGCHQNCNTCSGAGVNKCTTCPPTAHLAGPSPNICICNTGFPSPGVTNCLPCSTACVTCSGTGANDCLSCPAGKALAGPAPSNCVCPTGSYLNGSVCSLCATVCAACQGGTVSDCIGCKAKAELQGSAPSECRCRIGFYPSPDESNCVDCSLICLECSGAGSSKCVSCRVNAILIGNSCSCLPGFFPSPDPGSCSACSRLCQTCVSASPNACLSCSSHASLKAAGPGTCYCDLGFVGKPDVSHCVSCDVSCLKCGDVTVNSCLVCKGNAGLVGAGPAACACLPGYYPNPHAGLCSSCDPSCATCTSGTRTGCLDCKSHATLTYYFSCVCDPGYFFSSVQCSLCDPSCSTCVGASASDCLSCYSNAQMITSSRPAACICSIGFYASPDSGHCQVCESTCRTCVLGMNYGCTGCFASASLVGGASPSYCVCDRGYAPMPDSATCQACSQGCWTCAGVLASECLSCYPNAMLAGFSPNYCDCLPQYFPNPGPWNCLLCHSTCIGCSNGSLQGCLACALHASLSGPAPSPCICDIGYFPNPDTTSCSLCSNSCLTCADAEPGSCLHCKPNADLTGSAPARCVCRLGFFQRGGDCMQCNPTCVSCLSESEAGCTGCRDNAGIKGTMPAVCECILGYFPNPDSAHCEKCALGCQGCTQRERCWSCGQGYSLSGSACVQCPDNCSICDSQLACHQCLPGLAMNITGSCKYCDNCLTPLTLNISSPYDHIYVLRPNREIANSLQNADFELSTEPPTPLNWTFETQPEYLIKVTGGGPWVNSAMFILEIVGNPMDEFGNQLSSRYYELFPPKNAIIIPPPLPPPPSPQPTTPRTQSVSKTPIRRVGTSGPAVATTALVSGGSSGGSGLAAQLLGKLQYFAYIAYTPNALSEDAESFYESINQKTWMPNFFNQEITPYRRLSSELSEDRDFFETAGPFLSLLLLVAALHLFFQGCVFLLKPERQWIYSLTREFEWTVYFSLYAFAYLDLMVSAMLQLEIWTLSSSDIRGLIGTIASTIVLALGFLTPLAIIWILYAKQIDLGGWSFLAVSLRQQGKGRYYYSVFFAQRLAYAALLVALPKYPKIQCGLCVLPVAAMAGFVLLAKPLLSRLERLLQVISELDALAVYLLVCIATISQSSINLLSWISIALTLKSLLCSLLLLLITTFRSLRNCYHSLKASKTITPEVLHPVDLSFGPSVLFHKAA